MKTVAYTSKAIHTNHSSSNLADIPNILLPARKWNSKNGISGVLGYVDNYYLQVIEGPEEAVNTLISRLVIDPRHCEISFFVNQSRVDSARFFANQSMKLISSKDRNDQLIDYLHHHQAAITDQSDRLYKVLRQFHYKYVSQQNLSVFIDDETADQNKLKYEHQLSSFKLTQWPDFDVIEPSLPLFEMAMLMQNKYVSYQDILVRYFNGNKRYLNDTLARLEHHGILLTRKEESSIYHHGRATAPVKDNVESYFFKMKSFLKTQLSF